jgi:hypothetical protein
MKLNMRQAMEQTEHLLTAVERHKGAITIPLQNTFLVEDKIWFYRKILKDCHDRDARIPNCEEIATRWKNMWYDVSCDSMR